MEEHIIERLAKAAYEAHCREQCRYYSTFVNNTYGIRKMKKTKEYPYEELDDGYKEIVRAGVKAVFKEYNSILAEEREQRRLNPDFDRWRNTDTGAQKCGG